jgi:GNAT superfamily N-acetyltransferase
VRLTRPQDFAGIIAVCEAVYPVSKPWRVEQLESHLGHFPEGQLVAVADDGAVVGVASSLIINWSDYEVTGAWGDFTAHGTFSNHDPEEGRTLYGAELMVHPEAQGRGVGHQLYVERRQIARRLGLLRIRAGARLRGYGQHAHAMEPETYTRKVVANELRDPTLTFQLRHDFHVVTVVPGYLLNDPESLGAAAVIEWLNREAASPEEIARAEERWARWG